MLKKIYILGIVQSTYTVFKRNNVHGFCKKSGRQKRIFKLPLNKSP